MGTNDGTPVATPKERAAAQDGARPPIGDRGAQVRSAPVLGSPELLTAIIDTTPVGVCVTTDDGFFEQVNPAYERLYGYSAAELIGRHFTMVVPQDQRAALTDLHDRFISFGAEMRGEWEVITKDRSRRTILADACRLVGADGRYRKVTFELDITERIQMEADLADANERLAHLAAHDALTGLPNHHRSRELIDQAVEQAERYGRALSAAVIDLDHFKTINDTFGHLVGDDLLIAFARVMRSQLRTVDIAGRIGGEEFLVLMPETPASGARIVLERLRDCCRDQLRTPSGEPLRFSAGLVDFCPPEDADAVIRRADQALYRAKAAGRDRTEVG